jgi:hypothetical protein
VADIKTILYCTGPSLTSSDQDRSTIDYQGLASAEFFLHQEQIGLRYIVGFANAANWKIVAHAFIQAVPCWRSHILP